MASNLNVTNNAGTQTTIQLDGEVAVSGGPPEARVIVGRQGQPGKIIVRDFNGEQVFRFESPFGAHVFVGSTSGLAGFVHVISGWGKDGVLIDGTGGITLMDKNGKKKITLEGGGDAGTIVLKDKNDNTTLTLDGATGDIKLSGADCAEMFKLGDGSKVDAGTVLVMDDQGSVHPCDRAYDRRVTGVVSGAGNHRPGIILNSHGSESVPVALMGRVFCKVDATDQPIEVGDLLTTSAMIGHAMKASEAHRATGAVLGKAMGTLMSGQSLIPTLVTLG